MNLLSATPVTTNLTSNFDLIRYHVVAGYQREYLVAATPPDQGGELLLNGGGAYQRIRISDILFLQSEHVYVRIYLKNGAQILERTSLGNLLAKLPARKFMRVHRSFVINLRHVARWTSGSLFIADFDIPLSRTYKKEVLKRLQEITK